MKWDGLSRRGFAVLLAAAIAALAAGMPGAATAAERKMQVFKSPWCGCCTEWVDHMRAAGFRMHVTDLEDLSPVKAQLGVAPELQSCHTAVVDGYVIEGHVPARDVLRLLEERPRAAGLSVPGMPVGSPGMEQGDRSEPYAVILFGESERSVYARY